MKKEISGRKGQGATEYLVLLAIVLIIVIATITLIGFFSGAASDTSLAESQIYWKSATPIAIVETGEAYGYNTTANGYSAAYLRLKNTGSYPITITKVLGPGPPITKAVKDVWLPSEIWHDISISIHPGEENCFGAFIGTAQGGGGWDKVPCRQNEIGFNPIGGFVMWAQSSFTSTSCDTAGRGFITINSFGFEYNEFIEGVSISKKQIGTKALVIKCIGYCDGNTGVCHYT